MMEERVYKYKVKIEKTDVKHYDIEVDVIFADLIKWVDENYQSYRDYLTDDYPEETGGYPEGSEDAADFRVANNVDGGSSAEYYEGFVSQYFEDKDPDLLFTDNCHDHKKYELVSEECSLKSEHPEWIN